MRHALTFAVHRPTSLRPFALLLSLAAGAACSSPSGAGAPAQATNPGSDAGAPFEDGKVGDDGVIVGATADTCTDTPRAAMLGPFRTYAGDCVLGYQVDDDTFAKLAGSYDSTDLRSELAGLLRDELDFVTFVFDQEFGTNKGAFGYYAASQTCATTDCPKYLGTLHLTFSRLAIGDEVTAISNGPSLHEIQHHWANHGAVENPDDPTHWGFAGTAGQLGGWDPDSLEDAGGGRYFACSPTPTGWEREDWRAKCQRHELDVVFGTFANNGNAVPYSPVERWSMGLLFDAELPPIKVAVNAKYEMKGEDYTGFFTATEMKTVAAADLRKNLAAAGAPLPDPAKARRFFRMATVILSKSATLPDELVAAYNRELAQFAKPGAPATGQNFFSATGGRARMRVGAISTLAR